MKCFKHFQIAALMLLAVVLFFPSCKEDNDAPEGAQTASYDADVFLKWNQKFMELDRYARGNRPGTGPRLLAYLGLSAYESVVAGMPENNSMRHQFGGLTLPEAESGQTYYWPACINASYGYLMVRFFPQMQAGYPNMYNSIEQLNEQLHLQYAQETTPEILARSEAYGRAVAEAVYNWESLDLVGHDAFLNPAPSDYVAPVGPGLWLPTWSDYTPAVFPYWGGVRCFAMGASDLIAKPPVPYSEVEGSPFYMQALETYNMVNNINANGPGAYDGKWRAEFWSDDNLNETFGPPTRFIAIATQVVEAEHLNLAQSAELYAKLGMAMSDAGVAVWNSKYIYNVERPITYIQRVISQKYPEAATWITLLNDPGAGLTGITPPFPAYPSGHSGFAGAGGRILSTFFENTQDHPGAYTFTDLCHQDRTEFIGTPRTFTSFKEMGDENAYSRIPLGVHYRMDCDEGVRLGELSAQRVLEMPWKK